MTITSQRPLESHVTPPFALPGVSGEPSHVVLVASDGSEPSDSAVRLGALLARERGALPAIVSVLPPAPAVTPPLGGGIVVVPSDVGTPARRERRREELSRQLRDVAGVGHAWPTSIPLGIAAFEIEEAARENDAALIVVGLHTHSTLQRIFRDDVLLDVVRHATVPVLGVVASLERLPRRILVAMDFSRASVRAARAAAAVTGQGAEIVLAHVTPTTPHPVHEDGEGSRLVRELGVARAFESILQDLPRTHGMIWTPTIVEGDPCDALLDLAARMPAELLAVGTHRRTGVERFFLGSVTQAVLRAAPCSVLSARGELSR